jgi:hypothetical protein
MNLADKDRVAFSTRFPHYLIWSVISVRLDLLVQNLQVLRGSADLELDSF